MQQQQRPRRQTLYSGCSGGLRGDGRDAADAVWFLGCGCEAGAAAEGPADNHKVGGFVVLGEVVQGGDDVGGAVVCVCGEAVVEADAGDGEEEGEFVR